MIGDLLVFVSIIGLVVAVGIAVGMIVATRLDRILAPPGPRDPGSGSGRAPGAPGPVDPPSTEEQHP